MASLVERLREPDWHDPACPFSKHCYCGDDGEPAPHDRQSDPDKIKAAGRITALEAMCETLAGVLEQIANLDLLEIERYHERHWCIPETGNEYTSREPVFKRSPYQNAEDFQTTAREALTQYRAMKEKNDG